MELETVWLQLGKVVAYQEVTGPPRFVYYKPTKYSFDLLEVLPALPWGRLLEGTRADRVNSEPNACPGIVRTLQTIKVQNLEDWASSVLWSYYSNLEHWSRPQKNYKQREKQDTEKTTTTP